MAKSIVVYVEDRAGEPRKASLEAVSLARDLKGPLGAESVVAILAGSGVEPAAAGLARFGADRVVVADDATLKNPHPGRLARTVVGEARRLGAECVILAATPVGKDLGPRIAAQLGVPLASDCIGTEVEEGRILAKRPIYAGKAHETVRIRTSPAVVTIRPKAFPATVEDGRSAEVERITAEPAAPGYTVRGSEAAAGGRVDISEAEVIVAGGRAMKSPEGFRILEELADATGGAVGASRAAVDAGWRGHGDQVGQTGKTVSPTLYIACGISGSVQHLAGMSTSRCVVAINKDPEAPIFKVADYGIVGDLFEVVPRLTAELGK